MKDITLSQIRRALAKACLAGFVRATAPGYLMGWVHERICAELDVFLSAVSAGESPRLMLCMPPRHGKSELASRRFPAYVFGRYPDMSIIGTSYSADLSSRLNRDVQRVMEQPEYQVIFPETRLSAKDIRTVASGNYLRNSDLFEIVDHRGSYRSAGVGGGITGMGGDILIVDDPFKDRAEADSPTIRRKVWEWYTSTLYTRLAPGGGILVINTRWHMDDLSGRLLEAARTGEGDAWRVVNFPAIAEEDEKYRLRGE
ncbi:MAG: terminase, partial [Desulfovibrio sp.]|nr:terminase [Desulfovibrio sp.]